jgi:hypothetical protein
MTMGEPPASPEDGASPATPLIEVEPEPDEREEPFAALSTRAPSVVATAFDTLARSSGDLRRASFYIGLIVLALATPFAFLVWRVALQPFGVMPLHVAGPLDAAAAIAVVGVLVATVESRAVAVALLAARLAGRPADLRAAVERSRRVFWVLVAASILTNVPLLLVQRLLGERAAELFRGESELSVLGASLATALLFSPLAYVVTGIVLGDVGPWVAIKRSVRLFRAAKVTGVVVALFEFGSQLVTAFGVGAGLDLVLRAVSVTGLTGDSPTGAALTAALIVILLFALGTLVFTVAAISIAPQVVAFLGLTHVAAGLDRVWPETAEFRWLTRPLLAAMALGALAMFAGLAAFG